MPGRALKVQQAAVHLDQGLGQGQAQAGALGGLAVLALDLFERLGQPLQVFLADMYFLLQRKLSFIHSAHHCNGQGKFIDTLHHTMLMRIECQGIACLQVGNRNTY